jgi:hypothetical protein
MNTTIAPPEDQIDLTHFKHWVYPTDHKDTCALYLFSFLSLFVWLGLFIFVYWL